MKEFLFEIPKNINRVGSHIPIHASAISVFAEKEETARDILKNQVNGMTGDERLLNGKF